MQDLVNIGVIGAGYWGKKVIREYQYLANNNPNINLKLISDLKDKNLKYCNTVLNIPKEKLTNDYYDIITSQDIDAVHICTQNDSHYQICEKVLNANKHVLLEKPMTLNSKQALNLKKIAENRNLILKVGHIFRFNNALIKIKELLKNNYLGEIYYVKLCWTTLLNSPMNIGILYDLAPHPIDILNDLLDKWPIKATCKAESYRIDNIEDIAYIIFEFEGNVIAHIELSWLQPGKNRDLTIIGSQRCAKVDCIKQSIQINENDGEENFTIDVAKNNTILDEINNFIECTKVGSILRSIKVESRQFYNDATEGVKNIIIIENLKRSIDENETIKIKWLGLEKEMGIKT